MEKFQIYINSQAYENIDVTMKRYARSAERAVVQYLEDNVQTLENFAISEIAFEYKKCVDLFENTDFTGAQLLQKVGLHFYQLLEKVWDIVEESNNRRCSNKHGANSCGLLVQTVTRCDTCLQERIICAGGHAENQEFFDRCSCLCIGNKCTDLKTGLWCSPCRNQEKYLSQTLDCGERNIEVPEYEDLILDCSFDWHARLEQSRKIKFVSLMPVSLPFPHLLELESRDIEEPYVELKGIQKIDEGMYKCSTILESGVPVSTITYHVTVITGSRRTTEKYKPRPTHPHVLDLTTPEPTDIMKDMTPVLDLTTPEPTDIKDMTTEEKSLITFLAVSCIIIALIAAICVFICMKRIKKWKHQSAKEKDPRQKAKHPVPPV
ncbi:uncharacterized protein [Dendrobates tinctorius]